MTVQDEVQQLLGDAVERLSAGGAASAEEVMGNMLYLMAKLTAAVEHLATRLDQVSGVVD
jgi:hypothetical protein